MKASITLANITCGLIIALTSLMTLFSIEQNKQSKTASPSHKSCLKTCSETLDNNVIDIKNTVKI